MSDTRYTVPLASIDADHSFNCRGELSPIDVADLARDIKENGLMQPVIVSVHPDPSKGFAWRLIGGFRRYMATQINGDSEIWVSIAKIDDERQARYMNLRENIQRKDLTILQEAASLKHLHEAGATEKEMMEKLGMTRGWVQVRVMLLKLPQEIRGEVKAGFITQTEIRELYTLHQKFGKESCLSAAKEIKEIKLKGGKGSKVLDKVKKRVEGHTKRIRSKNEIYELQERLQAICNGNNLTTRILGWATGYVSDEEAEFEIRDWAEREGYTYLEPAAP